MEPINVEEVFRVMNTILEVLMPIMAIGAGIAVALMIMSFIVKLMVVTFEVKYTSDSISLWDRITNNLENIAERLQKRKALDHEYPEYPALELGLERPDNEPDGELIALNDYEQEGQRE
jgi:hypothetical protein